MQKYQQGAFKYQWRPMHAEMTIGGLSNHDGDGVENVTNVHMLENKQFALGCFNQYISRQDNGNLL